MAITVQFRRGTTAENDALTGAEGEILVDTTLDQLRVHDGVTAGGHKVARHVDISDKIQVANATLLINDRMQVANAEATYATINTVNSNLANTNAYIATKLDSSVYTTADVQSKAALANTNAWLTASNTAIEDRMQVANTVALVNDRMQVANATLLINDRMQVANVNTLINNVSANVNDRIQVANATLLINDRMQVANVAAAISTAIGNLVDSAPSTLDTLNELAAALGDDANFSTTITNSLASKATWTELLATNTAIRTLVDDRMQVANVESYLANTNAYIATKVNTSTFNSALANTNAYIASVAASGGEVANAYLTSTFTTNTAFQSYVANTNAWITTVEAASGGGGANTSQIESIVDGKIQVLEISDLIGGDGNLGEVLVSNGDGTGYWAPALREYVYTATNNQVTFTGNDVYGTSMSYKPGSIAIFLNGVKLMRSDYQANNGVSIVLNDGAAANDSIEVLSFAGPAVV